MMLQEVSDHDTLDSWTHPAQILERQNTIYTLDLFYVSISSRVTSSCPELVIKLVDGIVVAHSVSIQMHAEGFPSARVHSRRTWR